MRELAVDMLCARPFALALAWEAEHVLSLCRAIRFADDVAAPAALPDVPSDEVVLDTCVLRLVDPSSVGRSGFVTRVAKWCSTIFPEPQ